MVKTIKQQAEVRPSSVSWCLSQNKKKTPVSAYLLDSDIFFYSV